MKAVRPVIASNGAAYLQMGSVGLQSKSGREKEGKDSRSKNDFFYSLILLSLFLYPYRLKVEL